MPPTARRGSRRGRQRTASTPSGAAMRRPRITAISVSWMCSTRRSWISGRWRNNQSQRIHGSDASRKGVTGTGYASSGVGAMIALDSVSKHYPGGGNAVEQLTLEIREGETCVLVGPSGCGKSTTLRMINRLIEPTSGRILLDGEDVTRVDPVPLRLTMGSVIQQVVR